MGHELGLDYATYAKRGFLLGLGLVVASALVGTVGPEIVGPLPGWEEALVIDGLLAGIAIGFVSVFGFGIALPLTE